MSVATFVDRIMEARRTGATTEPDAEPQDRATAYEAQRLTAERLGASVAGWKVADHPQMGPVAAPIFSAVSRETGVAWPVTSGLGVEIEIALVMKRDLPKGQYSREDIAAAVESFAPGVELVGSRLAHPQRNLYAFLGDLMVNVGYVMGPLQRPVPDFDLPRHRCLFSIGDRELHNAPCKPPPLDPLAVVAAWLTRADDTLGGVKAGQYITTGSLCGIIPVSGKGRARAEIEGFGVVEFDLN